MRAALLRAVLVVGGVLCALVIGECAVRVLGLDPEIIKVARGRYRLSSDPMLGYEPVPGLEYHGSSLDYYDYRGSTNRLGYRDRDHAREKPPGVFRIVVIGDSISAGLYVARYQDTFPARLEGLLEEAGIKAEVINFGVSGYNTRQEVETLKVKGLAYHPDLVLVAYCLNDRERNDGGILRTLIKEAKAKGSRPPDSRWLDHSALYRFIRYRVLDRGTFDRLQGDLVDQAMRDLGRLSREHGFRTLVAVFPDFSMLGHYTRRREHESVKRLAAQQGFAFLDMLDSFRACPGKLNHDRYHPTALGHACAAAAMAGTIERMVRGQP